MPPPQIIIIAGPNGAGKTTFAREYLPREGDCPVFFNADLIAAGLSPFQTDAVNVRAGRLFLEEIDRRAREGGSFAFETTLSGRGYVRRIHRWRAAGYCVQLIFLSLAIPEEAISRVKFRVRQGGHNIPEDVIRRRFASGLENLKTIYRACVDDWILYDNSGPAPAVPGYGNGGKPVTGVPQKEPVAPTDQFEAGIAASLKRAAKRAHLIAHQTGTRVVVMRDGKVAEIAPDPAMYEDLLPLRRRSRAAPEAA